jgi:hypothetical protein
MLPRIGRPLATFKKNSPHPNDRNFKLNAEEKAFFKFQDRARSYIYKHINYYKSKKTTQSRHVEGTWQTDFNAISKECVESWAANESN